MSDALAAWSQLQRRWVQLAAHFRGLGLRCVEPSVLPPVSRAQLRDSELELGREFPPELRELYLENSRGIFFVWEQPSAHDSVVPDWCGPEGGLMIDYSATRDMTEELHQLAVSTQEGPDLTRYSHAFPFGYASRQGYDAGICCIDGRPDRRGQIIVLAGSSDSASEERPLASSLLKYVEAITELAFPFLFVGEASQFISERMHGLDTLSEAGVARRRAFRLV